VRRWIVRRLSASLFEPQDFSTCHGERIPAPLSCIRKGGYWPFLGRRSPGG